MNIFKNKIKSWLALSSGEIGIIAVTIFIVILIAVPIVVKKQQAKQALMQIQKFDGTMAKVFDLAQVDYGDVTAWNFEAGTKKGSEELLSKITPYLYIYRNCGTTGNNCAGKKYLTLSKGYVGGNYNPNNSDYAKAVLMDKSLIFVKSTYGSECNGVLGNSKALQNVCGEINVDLNGEQGPNRYGYDTFYFYLTKYGVVPFGTKAENANMTTMCNIYSTNNNNGIMCSGWVVKIGNLDFQSKNISWD